MTILNPAPGAWEISDVSASVLGEKAALYNCMQQKGLTLVVGPVALLWTVENVRNLAADPDPEDAASEHARSVAERLLRECTAATPTAISPIAIEQFEHDLLLRWQSNAKGLILTCPATDAQKPSLYREQIADGRAISTEMLADASSRDLAHSLRWMLEA